MPTLARHKFYRRFLCGHTEWQTLPDGPGVTMVMRRMRAEAELRPCPGCARHAQEIAERMAARD